MDIGEKFLRISRRRATSRISRLKGTKNTKVQRPQNNCKKYCDFRVHLLIWFRTPWTLASLMHFLQNYKMHEVRTASRPALADISGGGFFIRSVESPGAVVVKGAVKRLARQVQAPSSNKENVPPVGVVRAARKKRSPLPDWYPRTPLRDITSIVKVSKSFPHCFMSSFLNSVRVMTISANVWFLGFCCNWCMNCSLEYAGMLS